MQSKRIKFRTMRMAGLLVCGLGMSGGCAWADIRITSIETDGQSREIPALDARDPMSQPVRSTARTVRFHFTEGGEDGKPTARLRYKLEGHDDTWRDLPAKMRAIVYFRDYGGQVVATREFYLEGETPGWRGMVENSEFVARRESTIAPPRAASARISFQSIHAQSGDKALGLLGVDAVRLLIGQDAGVPPKIYDFGIAKGTDLGHPLGTPDNWVREGSRAELAILSSRSRPAPHPILVIQDDDPSFFGNWATSTALAVAPGDRVTLEWQTAHSIGGSGEGVASYPGLKPGRYLLRVAAAKANGELTGREISLPIVVVVPMHRRWEFWAITGALTTAAAAWIGHLAVQRRLQRQLAALVARNEMERERARIARDLHDNIGAGLTEIAMQSDWVHSDLAHGPTADTRQRVERIRQSATELARSVDEIVWATNPANDTVKRFVNYLTQCTAQFLDAAGVRVRFDIPEDMPSTALAGKVRHYLFLAVREALNNAVRHARPDLIRLEIRAMNNRLTIAVEDNGCGFMPGETSVSGTQEGLTNMRCRMEEIDGSFEISSRPGGGTRAGFSVLLADERHPQ